MTIADSDAFAHMKARAEAAERQFGELSALNLGLLEQLEHNRKMLEALRVTLDNERERAEEYKRDEHSAVERGNRLAAQLASEHANSAQLASQVLEEAAKYFETPPTYQLNDSGDLGSKQRQRVVNTLRNLAEAKKGEAP